METRALIRPDGTRLVYDFAGPASAPAVLLLHGLTQWSRQCGGIGATALLSERFRLILPDLRGHGRSDRPRSPGAYGRALVEDAAAILQAEAEGPVHLAGVSLGAEIVLRLAAERPGRARSQLAMGSGWSPPELAQVYSRYAGWLHDPATRLGTPDPDPPALEALTRAMGEVIDVPRAELQALDLPAHRICGALDAERPWLERLSGVLRGFSLELIPGVDPRASWSEPSPPGRISWALEAAEAAG